MNRTDVGLGLAFSRWGVEANNGRIPLRVLDPMAGSGTVLAVARSKGHRAFGFDLDPLAVLLAGVWTRAVNPDRVRDTAEDVLDRAKRAFGALRLGAAYPARSDVETQKFIRCWFDDYARRQLAALAAAIRRVHDDAVRDVLWCGFSRLIITKSAGASLAMDLSHSRPHLTFERAPIKPFNRFLSGVDTVVANCPQLGSGSIGPATVVKNGDARRLDVDSSSIDLVLTSPPYLNGIDYLRCSKFSLVWMGCTVRELRQIRVVCSRISSRNESATSPFQVDAAGASSLASSAGAESLVLSDVCACADAKQHATRRIEIAIALEP